MKRGVIILVALCLLFAEAQGQRPKKSPKTDGKNYYYPYSRFRGGFVAGTDVDPMTGDTTYTIQLSNIVAYRSIGSIKRERRLIRRVKKVYPYAVEAGRLLEELNDTLVVVTSEKERDRITKALEDQIVETYTPVLENMTFSEGKILIRLIERETGYTAFELVQEFRGKFSAKFWNMIARIFSANLKQSYNPTQGEDKLIEQIIILIEAGLL